MQRDTDLIRKILVIVEADGITSSHQLSQLKFKNKAVKAHFWMLLDGGLIVEYKNSDDLWAYRLTWKGHEQLSTWATSQDQRTRTINEYCNKNDMLEDDFEFHTSSELKAKNGWN